MYVEREDEIMTTVDKFRELGRQAHADGKSAAPTLHPEVRAAIAGLPVGVGAAAIFRAYLEGWDEANLNAPTIRLISIGLVPAVPLSEIVAGDTLVWNYGETSQVVSVAPVTATTYELVTRTADGRTWTQRKRGTTLVCRAAD